MSWQFATAEQIRFAPIQPVLQELAAALSERIGYEYTLPASGFDDGRKCLMLMKYLQDDIQMFLTQYLDHTQLDHIGGTTFPFWTLENFYEYYQLEPFRGGQFAFQVKWVRLMQTMLSAMQMRTKPITGKLQTKNRSVRMGPERLYSEVCQGLATNSLNDGSPYFQLGFAQYYDSTSSDDGYRYYGHLPMPELKFTPAATDVLPQIKVYLYGTKDYCDNPVFHPYFQVKSYNRLTWIRDFMAADLSDYTPIHTAEQRADFMFKPEPPAKDKPYHINVIPAAVFNYAVPGGFKFPAIDT